MDDDEDSSYFDVPTVQNILPSPRGSPTHFQSGRNGAKIPAMATTTDANGLMVSIVQSKKHSDTSAAATKIEALRSSLRQGTEQFQFAVEKRGAEIGAEGQSLRRELFVLDQHVCHEAKNREQGDEAVLAFLDRALEESCRKYDDFFRSTSSRISSSVNGLDTRLQASLDEISERRASQEALLDAIRNEHHDSIAELNRELNATRSDVIRFETQFSHQLSASIGQLEDRMTIELSIRQRMAADVRQEAAAMLGKDDAQKQFEKQTGELLVAANELKNHIKRNALQREDASAAFSETLTAMVQEVDAAVKKMSASRGLEQLVKKREQLQQREAARASRSNAKV